MRHDVVFHVDHDAQTLEIAFSNIQNYFSFFTNETPSVVLVVNGPGVRLLDKDGEYADPIREIAGLGASVRVCNNALRHFGVDPERLCPECVVVPAGVVEIVALQEKGFSYVKP